MNELISGIALYDAVRAYSNGSQTVLESQVPISAATPTTFSVPHFTRLRDVRLVQDIKWSAVDRKELERIVLNAAKELHAYRSDPDSFEIRDYPKVVKRRKNIHPNPKGTSV